MILIQWSLLAILFFAFGAAHIGGNPLYETHRRRCWDRLSRRRWWILSPLFYLFIVCFIMIALGTVGFFLYLGFAVQDTEFYDGVFALWIAVVVTRFFAGVWTSSSFKHCVMGFVASIVSQICALIAAILAVVDYTTKDSSDISSSNVKAVVLVGVIFMFLYTAAAAYDTFITLACMIQSWAGKPHRK